MYFIAKSLKVIMGLSLLEKHNGLCLHSVLGTVQKKKKIVSIKLFPAFESMASLDKQHELHLELHCNKTSSKVNSVFLKIVVILL